VFTVTGSRKLNKILYSLLRVQSSRTTFSVEMMAMNNKIITISVFPGQPNCL